LEKQRLVNVFIDEAGGDQAPVPHSRWHRLR
jgi:hypothetical protein